MRTHNKGIALIAAFMVIVVLVILGVAIFSRSIGERQIVKRYADSAQALWLAEAGINNALSYLRVTFVTGHTELGPTPLGAGSFS